MMPNRYEWRRGRAALRPKTKGIIKEANPGGEPLFFINPVGTLLTRDLVHFYSAIDTRENGAGRA